MTYKKLAIKLQQEKYSKQVAVYSSGMDFVFITTYAADMLNTLNTSIIDMTIKRINTSQYGLIITI